MNKDEGSIFNENSPLLQGDNPILLAGNRPVSFPHNS